MRRNQAFSAIKSEGGLLPADLLARVAANEKSVAGLSPEAYHLAPGERLTEVITRSWNRLIGAWTAFSETLEKLPTEDKTATNITRQRWTLVLFQELGYGQLQPSKGDFTIGEKSYPISHAWGTVPIHLPGAKIAIDRRTAGVAGAASMSPHGLVQEFLNRSEEHLWGFICNGLQLRLLRDNVSLTRPAFVEFDLQRMFSGQAYHEFVVLWLVCHQSRLEGDVAEKCLLEQWVADAADRGTRALDQLRIGVETAITALGEGFLAHRTNAPLRERIRSGDLDKRDYQRELLRLVYRLIFLLVAESRELLLRPDADATTTARYRQFYGVTRLRALAETQRGSAHADLWQSLRVVMRALGSPSGEPHLGLPSLGSFLWSDSAIPALESAQLDNRHLLAAVRALTSVRDGKVVRSVDYRNLGAEELGSIYESLLELHPDLDVDTGTFALTTAAGNERKTTGSYYTPTSLINELLDSALEPVLDDAVAAADPEKALLAVTVLDPACGSGHFLIAAAHRIARRLASVRTGDGEPSPDATRSALRDVVGRCIHGIDVNEMAVELCKVSLWMEAVEPGRPLSFLEHRIVHGNSLLGATPRVLAEGVPDDAFKPLEGDDRATVTELKKRNKKERAERKQLTFDFGSVFELAQPVARAIEDIDSIAEDDVVAKEKRWAEFVKSDERERARLAADAWCAAFVALKKQAEPVVTDRVVRAIAQDPARVPPEILQTVRSLREQYSFLHLHLAFPDVFEVPKEGERPENETMGWSGGFSCVLGNPPWERVKLQEKEFFAERAPSIATAANSAARKRLIEDLALTDPALFGSFKQAVRKAEAESHILRSSGRFPLCGRGDVNTYSVFAEAMRSAASQVGRSGVIVPLGIATDDTTKAFFGDLVSSGSLDTLFGFENEEFLFPGVHHSTKFCALTIRGRGSRDPMRFAFFLRRVSDLREDGRTFSLTADDFRSINPNTLTCPIFRTSADAELTRRIYAHSGAVLVNDAIDDNPWKVRLWTMFHMSNDSKLFREHPALDALPLFEGKMIYHFNHRFGTYEGQTQAQANQGKLPESPSSRLADPCYRTKPKYWVSADEVDRRAVGRNSWFIGWRRITNSIMERTLTAAVVPRSAVGDNLFLIEAPDSGHALSLVALMNSMLSDYISRQKLGGTNFLFYVLKQLPFVRPCALSRNWGGDPLNEWLRIRALELTYTAWDLSGFGSEAGCDAPFAWDDGRRQLLRAEIDAAVMHLYEVTRAEAVHVLDSFAVLAKNEAVECGEYRTKRLILECYDAMAKAIETGEPYQTILDPPPADPSLCHPESTRPEWAKA